MGGARDWVFDPVRSYQLVLCDRIRVDWFVWAIAICMVDAHRLAFETSKLAENQAGFVGISGSFGRDQPGDIVVGLLGRIETAKL